MIALSGVRSSCDIDARNADLCLLAISSWRLFSWISSDEPRVLDRDHRLVGERAQQRDLAIGKRRHLVTPHREDADGIGVNQHGHAQHGVQRNKPFLVRQESGVRLHVVDLHHTVDKHRVALERASRLIRLGQQELRRRVRPVVNDFR